MKKCTRCQKTKIAADFAKDPTHKDRRASRCKPCMAKTARQRRRWQKRQISHTPAILVCSTCKQEKAATEFHLNRCRKTGRTHQCKQCVLVAAARHRRKAGDTAYNRLNTRERRLKQLYGLSLAAYDAWRLQQGNCCALCSKPFEDDKIHVDHDHKTGQLRGLLCPKCNVGLGLFNDDPALLTTALEYLTRTTVKHRSG